MEKPDYFKKVEDQERITEETLRDMNRNFDNQPLSDEEIRAAQEEVERRMRERQ